MAPRELRAAALLSLGIAGACTVFNGKTFTPDGGIDASVPEAGAVTNDGAARCGCPDEPGIVCEDFEGTDLGVAWQKAGSTLPERDTKKLPHCGQGALRVSIPAFGANSTATSVIEARMLGDARFANDLYVRAWVFVPKNAELIGDNYFQLVEVRQDVAPFVGIGLGVNVERSLITNWTPSPSEVASTGGPFPRDTWTCVEWHVAFGASGASQVWFDGASTAAASLEPTLTAPTPPYSTLVIGAYFSSAEDAQPPFEFWIDDVVFGPQRIGCNK